MTQTEDKTVRLSMGVEGHFLGNQQKLEYKGGVPSEEREKKGEFRDTWTSQEEKP